MLCADSLIDGAEEDQAEKDQADEDQAEEDQAENLAKRNGSRAKVCSSMRRSQSVDSSS
jgi:hypothetical protein